MSRWMVGLAAAGLVLLRLLPLEAADPPHWTSTSLTFNCTTQCHLLHQAQGGTLTQAAGNVTLCQSCHRPSGVASGQPVNTSDKAILGTAGTSHAFDVAAVNAGLATQLPLNSEMATRVMGGQVVCSTCHNQHAGQAAFGGMPQVRPAKKVTALGSTGAVTSGGTFTGSNGLWYLVEIQTAGAVGTSRFRWSKDNGISWMGSNIVTATSPAIALDNGVTASFGAGNYNVGERWEFSGSWPFLRAALDSGANGGGSAFCRDCHRSWVMDHTGVEAWDGAPKSHPVGVGLGANGQGYDRATPLDGNGAPQGGAGADANRSNDLSFDASGRVQCLTCHNVHYADSNTQTVDGP